MGRYYHGTIGGKFWFGVQSSYDASSFKDQETNKIPIEYFEYYNCGCQVEKTQNLYCNQCYSTYQEHYDDLDDDDKENIDDEEDDDAEDDDAEDNDKKKLLAHPSGHIKYEFDESDLEYIKLILSKLESEIGIDVITQLNFTIDENENDEFEYDINNDVVKNIDDIKAELIARWCLGKQIKKAIDTVEYCTIFCEI